MLNDALPMDNFQVGVYRTIQELFKETPTGIVFRDKNMITISKDGVSMVIEIKDKDFHFKGLHRYSGDYVEDKMRDFNVDWMQKPEKKEGLNAVDSTSAIKGSRNNTMYNAKQQITPLGQQQTNETSQSQQTQQKQSQQHPQQGQFNSNAPVVTNNAPIVNDIDNSNIERYSDDEYKKAIKEADIDINKLIESFKEKGIPQENIDTISKIKSEVKDAYTDGNDYIYITTFGTDGSITTGIIEKGNIKFTKADWKLQSDTIKKLRK